MTGQEHYRDANRLLKAVDDCLAEGDTDRAELLLTGAQVHASLAGIAAMLDGVYVSVNSPVSADYMRGRWPDLQLGAHRP